MQPISSRMTAALQESHEVAFAAEVWTANQTQLLVDRSGLRIYDGSVTVDCTGATRRVATVQLVDPTGALLPNTDNPAASPISPYGNEMILYRGVTFPEDGTSELVQLGVFPIAEIGVTDTVGPELTVQLYDRSRKIGRCVFVDPYVVNVGTQYVAAIFAICDFCLPFIVAKVDQSGSGLIVSTQITYGSGDNPWQSMISLAAAIGCEVFFDPYGTLIIDVQPDPGGMMPNTWVYSDGANAMITTIGANISDDPGYNGVQVTGDSSSNTGTVGTALAVDNDPASPTYYFGDYGKVTLVITDPLATSNAIAMNIATTQLHKQLGLAQALTFSAIPNPAHEACDMVQVVRSIDKLDVMVMLSTFTIPLNVSTAASYSTRAQKVTS